MRSMVGVGSETRERHKKYDENNSNSIKNKNIWRGLKKMRKMKLMSLVLAVVMVVGLMPVEVLADMGKKGFYNTVSAYSAISEDGSLYVWGMETVKGLIEPSESVRLMTPTKTSKITDAVFVSINFHSAAITSDGSLYTWGDNRQGQLGLGERGGGRELPEKVQGISDVIAVSTRASGRTVALTSDGSIYIWGGISSVPEKVKGISDVVAISAGTSHQIALTSDGSVYAWGGNDSGQLGLGAGVSGSMPTKIQTLSDVVAIASGAHQSLAVTSDGSLYAWGANWAGQLGLGDKERRWIPTKVSGISNVVSVNVGDGDSSAITADGSVYTWGSNYRGQLGLGDTEDRLIPTKVPGLSNVVTMAKGEQHSVAVTAEGELYAWGKNFNNQLGLGTGGASEYAHANPTKTMSGVKLPTAIAISPRITPTATAPTTITPTAGTQPTATPAPYIYDSVDPGASVVLDSALLASVTDQASAIKAIEAQASRLTAAQKQSPTGADLMTLFATEAVANASSQTASSGSSSASQGGVQLSAGGATSSTRRAVSDSSITINQSNVQALQSNAASAKTAAVKALSSAGVNVAREIDETVKFKTSQSGSVTITVEATAANTTADNVCIEMPDYSITLSKEMIEANTKDSPLIITIAESNSVAMLNGEGSAFVAAANNKSRRVELNKNIEGDLKISLPASTGDNSYTAVFDEGGYVKGGKYNPAIDKVEARINTSGTYTTKENRKDFSDIQSKSAEMQEAIRVLSSKGIINGTSETAFSPDSPITRAQIAMLITKTLSKLDANANGGFSDVKSSDWFYGAAGSAKNHGIMSGTSATTFAPNVNIPKDQIVAVSARVLRNEMKYNNPTGVDAVLNKYSDKSAIPDWAKTDVALATQLNLVVYRTDGDFSPSGTMTRGDAAVILYRMFMKIW